MKYIKYLVVAVVILAVSGLGFAAMPYAVKTNSMAKSEAGIDSDSTNTMEIQSSQDPPEIGLPDKMTFKGMAKKDSTEHSASFVALGNEHNKYMDARIYINDKVYVLTYKNTEYNHATGETTINFDSYHGEVHLVMKKHINRMWITGMFDNWSLVLKHVNHMNYGLQVASETQGHATAAAVHADISAKILAKLGI